MRSPSTKWRCRVLASLAQRLLSVLIKLMVLTGLLAVPSVAAAAQVAIFPLLDISRGANGINLPFTSYLTERLAESGTEFFRLDTVISFMSHNRIRVAGQLESFYLKQVQEDLGVAYVLLGSILQGKESATPSLALTLNLIRTYDGQTLWTYVGVLSAAELRKPLGIGEVSSLAELQVLLADNLLPLWPANTVNREQQDSTRIDLALLEPKFVKPGDEVRISVRFRDLWPAWRSPKVFIKADDQLHAALRDGNSSRYVASWTAGEKDVRIPVALYLEWPLYGRTETIPLGSYLIDGVPPLVAIDLKGQRQVAGDVPIFRDRVAVLPRLIVNEPIARWRITFKASNEVVVATEEHAGNIPDRIVWAGQNLFEGREVEGVYQAIFEVWDEAGNMASASSPFELKNVPPQVTMVAEMDGPTLVMNLQHNNKVPLAFWRLEMWSEDGRLLEESEGQELPDKISVKLQRDEQKQKIESILVARDVLGNRVRQQVKDLFPAPSPGSDEAAEKDKKSATESWVNEF